VGSRQKRHEQAFINSFQIDNVQIDNVQNVTDEQVVQVVAADPRNFAGNAAEY
jgi:hypothetical protein